ncbi:MAG: hypothetical protein R2788_21220 [Saprospiraceae bacterium]
MPPARQAIAAAIRHGLHAGQAMRHAPRVVDGLAKCCTSSTENGRAPKTAASLSGPCEDIVAVTTTSPSIEASSESSMSSTISRAALSTRPSACQGANPIKLHCCMSTHWHIFNDISAIVVSDRTYRAFEVGHHGEPVSGCRVAFSMTVPRMV